MKKKILKEIIKTVGLNGLIGIKAQFESENRSFYKTLTNVSGLGFTAQNLIFHYRVMIKDYAQQKPL